MRKKIFEKPSISVKAINYEESIVASITVLDNGFIGGSYATTYYALDESGNPTEQTGTHQQGCFDILTNISNVDLSQINSNWEFNGWVINNIFGGSTDISTYSDVQLNVYRQCCHFD